MSVVAVQETRVPRCIPVTTTTRFTDDRPLEMAWRAGALMASVLHDVRVWGQPPSW